MRLRPSMLMAAVMGGGWASPFTRTFYVSTDGNDDNNGLTRATAWRHHPWDVNATGTANTTTLNAGDGVVLRGGDIFYSARIDPAGGTAGLVTTLSIPQWGNGPAVLSGAVDPSTLTWAADGGSYKCTLTTQPNVVVFDAIRLTFTAGAGNAVALNCFDWSANTLYVNVGADPATGTLKAAVKSTIILNERNAVKFQRLVLEMENGSIGAVFNDQKTGMILDQITVRYSNSYGFYCYLDTNTIISNCEIYNTGNSAIYMSASITPTINGNIVHGGTAYIGIQFASITAGLIYQNTAYLNRYGINLTGCTACEVYQNQVYQNGTGYYGHSNIGAGVYLNNDVGSLVYRNNIYDNVLGVLVSGNSYASQVHYNLVRNNRINDIDIYGTTDGDHVEVYNNVVIHSPSDQNTPIYTGHGIDVQSGGKKAKIANNIIVVKQTASNCQGISISNTAVNVIEVMIDNNIIFDGTVGGDGHLGVVDATTADTIAAWRAAVQGNAKILGMDGVSENAEANSLDDNPLFVDILSDWHLQSGSPAIDAGRDVGLSVDYDGVIVGETPEIGAYEYV